MNSKAMQHRFRASTTYRLPIFADGSAFYLIRDTVTGKIITTHRFSCPHPNAPDHQQWIEHNGKIATALADMLNQASGESAEALIALLAVTQLENDE